MLLNLTGFRGDHILLAMTFTNAAFPWPWRLTQMRVIMQRLLFPSGFDASWPRRCALAGILILGAGIRTYGLGTRSFWTDEAFTWRMIEFPVGEMLVRISQDNHPPLYFL